MQSLAIKKQKLPVREKTKHKLTNLCPQISGYSWLRGCAFFTFTGHIILVNTFHPILQVKSFMVWLGNTFLQKNPGGFEYISATVLIMTCGIVILWALLQRCTVFSKWSLRWHNYHQLFKEMNRCLLYDMQAHECAFLVQFVLINFLLYG